MKTRSEVVADLQSIVQTERYRWADTAWKRAISAALTAFNRDRPLMATAVIALKAYKGMYAADESMIRYLGTYWGLEPQVPVWDQAYPGVLPRIMTVQSITGMCLQFLPAPNGKHIALYGDQFEYLYAIAHVLTDDDCSIKDDDYDLFVTRALAALMRDLIAANVTEPVQLHRGLGAGSSAAGMPNSATPLAAYQALMQAYTEGVGNGC